MRIILQNNIACNLQKCQYHENQRKTKELLQIEGNWRHYNQKEHVILNGFLDKEEKKKNCCQESHWKNFFEWLDHCIAVMEENVLILWKHMLKHLAAKEHSICTFSQFRKQYYVYAPTRFFFNIRALLKYDSHTTKFTLFKCTIQYF